MLARRGNQALERLSKTSVLGAFKELRDLIALPETQEPALSRPAVSSSLPAQRPLTTTAAALLSEPQPAESRLFNKLLVANRGEIAVRIMRTARKLGIPTVSVFSDADKDAVHTRFADEAICIGPPASTKSYLSIPSIVEAIQRTGADAVHPGYGFLSENSDFAEAVGTAGATFVGPPAHALHAMGDKVESKRFAREASINTIPGWAGVVESIDHAVSVAQDIGFPVMIKASAGGGGKGMRIAWDEKDLAEGFTLATQEAASAFGDSRMLIEKYVERPRHVEIQVLGDTQGNVIYLPERECSIQRRNQKVIEEAPCPVATPELRAAMGQQAVALCKQVGYYSAGTCEFLVDKHLNFYFLEMNTRLQVEHPITEAITGLDLVECMLRVAAGLPLGITQEEVAHPKGWAVECRVYAEDPARGFLPSTGRLQRYIEPRGHGIRVDSGVEEGSDISMHYDPMISKLVGQGPDRKTALARAARALDAYVIRGVQHNAPLLRSVLEAADFASGDISTAFLADHFPHPEDSAPARLPLNPAQEQESLAMAVSMQIWRDVRHASPNSPNIVAAALGKCRKLVIGKADGTHVNVTVRPAPPAMVPALSALQACDTCLPALQVELPDRMLLVVPSPPPDARYAGSPLVAAEIDGQEVLCQMIERGPRHVTLQYCGAQRKYIVDSPAAAAVAGLMPQPVKEDLSKVIKSPMPGLLVNVTVAEGDQIEAGDEIAVVEAMKMRNQLKSIAAGRVLSVEAKVGSNVAADQVIVRLE